MISPTDYFEEHNLYDWDVAQQHAEENSVRISRSNRFPGVALFHYKDEAQFDKNWNTFSRMSRGLIVDMKNKRILAHPFHKFFNVGEMPETNYDKLLLEGSFEVSEKLDGSMLITFQNPSDGKYHFTTKGSLDSEHGQYATTIMSERMKTSSWISDYTLMFELIAKKFQIVVDYKKKGYAEGVYLIGARHRSSNKLLSYSDLQKLANELHVPTVQTYLFDSLDEVIAHTEILPVLDEGYVVIFESGLRIKIKGAEYLRVHRFISRLSDGSILDSIKDNTFDQIIELAPEEYKEGVREKAKLFKTLLNDWREDCRSLLEKSPRTSRKEFALWVKENVPAHLRPFLFEMFDGKEPNHEKLCRTLAQKYKVTHQARI